MRPSRALLAVCAAAALMGAGPARAGVAARRSHVVESGESLWTIARTYQCDVEELRRANRMDGNLIRPGQRLRIPVCEERTASTADTSGDEVTVDAAQLEQARDQIPDEEEISPGERMVDTAAIETRTESTTFDENPVAVPLTGQSFGRPQNGYLVSGKRMPRNPAAYYLRRPERAWGTDHMVAQLVRAIHLVRRRYPRVHPLAIGDLSSRHGGRLTMHGSHQSGRDADIGFYFRKRPRTYPKSFVVATADNLDFRATWAFLSALCKTAESPLGVERIYLTYSTQALFYRLARKHRVPAELLDKWFQYPHGRRADHGIIRHEPGHEEHMHVRFRCAPTDLECE